MPELRTHAPAVCEGEYCVVHNPSDHHMKDWPVAYRTDRRVEMPPRVVGESVLLGGVFVLAERICPHGVGHPDPDAMAFARREGGDEFADAEGVHGCDLCCRPPRDPSKPITPEETAEIAEYYDTHCSVSGEPLSPDPQPVSGEFFDRLHRATAVDDSPIVLGGEDAEDDAAILEAFDAALAAGEQVLVTAPPEGWTGAVERVCGHCGMACRGYGFVDGVYLCHTGTQPPWDNPADCYRLVTVYEHDKDGACWCRDLDPVYVGLAHTAPVAAGGRYVDWAQSLPQKWHGVDDRVGLPDDEPVWVALKPVAKMDGPAYYVEVAYYDFGEFYSAATGEILSDDVAHWAEIRAPKHPEAR